MKEEFKELYDFIIHSNDEEKMHVLGKVTKDMMCKFIESYPQQAREYLDMLQSVKWHNYVTAREAESVIADMKPKPLWTRAVWESTMTKHGLPMSEEPYYNESALYLTMCMISSDSGDTIHNLVGDDPDKMFKAVYQFALDKLKDKDGVFDVRWYFDL
jgi:hypothetical protein